ncbi:class I SAM-dependent methyltransferase [bacterium]|nr:MAG: class I SAM-dependent methyltransferase [bacterium]
MQFPNKVKSIKDGDKVLEIGPGGNPFNRSDIYLELKLSEKELAAQRGYAQKPILNGKVVYYDGKKFPFKDNEFDYVICSHVIEHVPDVKKFLSEMFRVSKSGYIEYPTIYYEYLYNFDVHLNFMKFDHASSTMRYLPKSKTNLQEFSPVQKIMRESLEKGHVELVDSLKDIMFEGFEWSKKFGIEEVDTVSKIAFIDNSIEVYSVNQGYIGKRRRLKLLLKKLVS